MSLPLTPVVHMHNISMYLPLHPVAHMHISMYLPLPHVVHMHISMYLPLPHVVHMDCLPRHIRYIIFGLVAKPMLRSILMTTAVKIRNTPCASSQDQTPYAWRALLPEG